MPSGVKKSICVDFLEKEEKSLSSLPTDVIRVKCVFLSSAQPRPPSVPFLSALAWSYLPMYQFETSMSPGTSMSPLNATNFNINSYMASTTNSKLVERSFEDATDFERNWSDLSLTRRRKFVLEVR